MGDELKEGLRIGNFVIVPRRGSISGARGTVTVSADRIKLLLALAENPDSPMPFGELASAVRCDADEVQHHLQSLREILGDTGPHPRFIAIDETTATLIAPVRAGLGSANTLVDSN